MDEELATATDPAQIKGPADEWTIVTVTYDSVHHLSLRWKTLTQSGATWIVVDNNSRDGSAERAAELGAKVIRLTRNEGFASANNVGLQLAESIYVGFVNPDVHVNADNLVILAQACDSIGGIVAPQLLNSDGSLQPNGRGLPFLVDKLAHRHVRLPGSNLSEYLPDTSSLGARTLVPWVLGAAVCARRSDFERISGWDQRYFLYYEDHSLGLRAWEAGIPVAVEPSVKWEHEWQRETKGVRFTPWKREVASAARFYRRYPLLLLPWRSPMRRRFESWQTSLSIRQG